MTAAERYTQQLAVRDKIIAEQNEIIAKAYVALKAIYDDWAEYARINDLHDSDGSTNHAMRQAGAVLALIEGRQTTSQSDAAE